MPGHATKISLLLGTKNVFSESQNWRQSQGLCFNVYVTLVSHYGDCVLHATLIKHPVGERKRETEIQEGEGQKEKECACVFEKERESESERKRESERESVCRFHMWIARWSEHSHLNPHVHTIKWERETEKQRETDRKRKRESERERGGKSRIQSFVPGKVLEAQSRAQSIPTRTDEIFFPGKDTKRRRRQEPSSSSPLWNRSATTPSPAVWSAPGPWRKDPRQDGQAHWDEKDN
jgi:hypothetical protein